MLLPGSHWNVAPNGPLERERRLLAFAPNTAPAAPQGPDAQNQQNAVPDPGGNAVNMTKNEMAELIATAIKESKKDTEADDEVKAAKTDVEVTKRQKGHTVKSVATRAGSTENGMEKILKRMENKKTLEKYRSLADAESIEAYDQKIASYKKEKFNTTQERVWAEELDAFMEGDIPPREFMKRSEQYLARLPYGFGTVGQALLAEVAKGKNARFTEAELNDANWETLDPARRKEIISFITEGFQIDSWASEMMVLYKKIDEFVEAEQAVMKDIEEFIESDDLNKLSAVSEGGFINFIKQARFNSIMDWIRGAKKWWDAATETWNDRSDRNSSDTASFFGRAMQGLPILGEETNRTLDVQLESKRTEESNKMKEYLTRRNANWHTLFGDSGFFKRFAGKNANKTRGILEYAADHGLLYDVDENISSAQHPIYGKTLKSLCYDWAAEGDQDKLDNYYSLLRGNNASGREKEIDGGYKKEFDVENVPKFMETLRIELDDFNLWSATGIVKRAMERGLWGEVSPWLLTTIMAKLEDNPKLRQYVPVTFFDNIGKLSMYKTGFTTGWAKAHRTNLRQWAKTGDRSFIEGLEVDYATKHSPIIADIRRLDPNTDYDSKEGKQKLEHTLAKVLASKVVKLPGGYIHIFESKYAKYREGVVSTFESMEGPTKEDSDFATETTEKTMLSAVVYKQILSYSSTFEFENESWAKGFLTSLIKTAVELKHIPALSEAYNNYINAQKQKFDTHFGAFLREERASRLLMTTDNSGKPLIAQLVAEGMLSWKGVMDKAKYNKTLIEQLKEHFPDAYLKHIAAPRQQQQLQRSVQGQGSGAAETQTATAI